MWDARRARRPVETFTIDLKEAPGGGELDLVWGVAKLSGNFTVEK